MRDKNVRKLFGVLIYLKNSFIHIKRTREAKRRLAKYTPPHKLHVGCGNIRFEGWINVDLNAHFDTVDVLWDITRKFPANGESCSLIYSEHLIEHLPVDLAVAFFADAYRLLQPGGVIRIAMPSLSHLVRYYLSDNWRDQEWLKSPKYQYIKTPAEMLNVSFRGWGHLWLYDEVELQRRLREAGFAEIRNAAWGVSTVNDLANRESRKDSLLICEAIK